MILKILEWVCIVAAMSVTMYVIFRYFLIMKDHTKVCPRCNGKGQHGSIWDNKEWMCLLCNGTGFISKYKK